MPFLMFISYFLSFWELSNHIPCLALSQILSQASAWPAHRAGEHQLPVGCALGRPCGARTRLQPPLGAQWAEPGAPASTLGSHHSRSPVLASPARPTAVDGCHSSTQPRKRAGHLALTFSIRILGFLYKQTF